MVHIPNRIWQMSTKYEKLAGYWPYQNPTKNVMLKTVISIALVSYLFPMLTRIVKEWNNNFVIVVENSIIVSIIIVTLAQLSSVCLFSNQRRTIVDKVAEDFGAIDDEQEVRILRHYSNVGFKWALSLIGFLCVSTTIFDGIPVLQMYLPNFAGNRTLERSFPLYVDYLVDEREYFYYIIAHLIVSLGLGMLAMFTYDLTFILTVSHACALFAIVRQRLERASEILDKCELTEKRSQYAEKNAYKILVSAVDLHNDAVRLVKSIDNIYNFSHLVLVIVNTGFLALFPLLMSLFKDNPTELFRYFGAIVGILIHFYIIFEQGQQIIDHSSAVFDDSYNFRCYEVSKKFRIVISMMMQQSLVPHQITGGKLFVLSMETYAMMMKTGLSYYSMLAAMV